MRALDVRGSVLILLLLSAGLGDFATPTCRRAPSLDAVRSGHEWFVDPAGAASHEGSRARPLDLATALSAESPAQPGDTIWLRGGTYRGAFTSVLTGTADAPVIVRQYPGERATIDGAGVSANTLTVRGAYTWYWGFEVTNSDPTRVYHHTVNVEDPASPDRVRGVGVNVFGPHTKFINLIVHDVLGGFGLWETAVDVEVYGALTYHNGVIDPMRGHGHGLYIQNRTGTKRIIDVISFGNHATGMKVYGEAGYGIGVHFEGVSSFNNGIASLTGTASEKIENLFVGTTDHPADRISLLANTFYHPPQVVGPNVTLGYQNRQNGTISIRDNVIMGGSVALTLKHWAHATVTGNRLYAETSGNPNTDQSLTQVRRPRGGIYLWNDNAYIDGTRQQFPFTYNTAVNRWGGGNLAWTEWRRRSGFDRASSYVAGRPTGTLVQVRPNRYEAGRAHLVIYNWDRRASVAVDLSAAALAYGAPYEIRDAQNYFGPAVVRGRYDGIPVIVPLTGLTPADPVGKVLFPPVHTAPEFATFVVQSP